METRDVAIETITSVGNVRTELPEIAELSRSIARLGVVTPLIVRRGLTDEEGEYVVIDGHRRLAAAEQAGKKLVPVTVVDAGKAPREVVQGAHNAHRGLTMAEQAKLYLTLRDVRGMGHKEIVDSLAISASHGNAIRRVAKMDGDALALAGTAGIPTQDIVAIASLPKGEQVKAVKSLAKRRAAKAAALAEQGKVRDRSGSGRGEVTKRIPARNLAHDVRDALPDCDARDVIAWVIAVYEGTPYGVPSAVMDSLDPDTWGVDDSGELIYIG